MYVNVDVVSPFSNQYEYYQKYDSSSNLNYALVNSQLQRQLQQIYSGKRLSVSAFLNKCNSISVLKRRQKTQEQS